MSTRRRHKKDPFTAISSSHRVIFNYPQRARGLILLPVRAKILMNFDACGIAESGRRGFSKTSAAAALDFWWMSRPARSGRRGFSGTSARVFGSILTDFPGERLSFLPSRAKCEVSEWNNGEMDRSAVEYFNLDFRTRFPRTRAGMRAQKSRGSNYYRLLISREALCLSSRLFFGVFECGQCRLCCVICSRNCSEVIFKVDNFE